MLEQNSHTVGLYKCLFFYSNSTQQYSQLVSRLSPQSLLQNLRMADGKYYGWKLWMANYGLKIMD